MPTKSITPATFGETLLHALEQFPDAATLGRTSPLAMPYLLGTHLAPSDDNAQARGRVLQRLLRSAVDNMAGTDAPLHRAILEERYFKGQSAVAVYQGQRVPLAKTQYFKHQKEAVAQLEPHLLDLLNPTLRLEQPVQPAGALLGRDQVMARLLAALRQKETVMLSGSGGVGKTSLAGGLAQAWGGDLLWFTVRPGLNDHLAGFLFELAYFCHLRGASWLWQELIANHGQLPGSRVPAIVRRTVADLAVTPLLVIDEADLLLPPVPDTSTGPHDSSDGDAPPSLSLLQLLTSLRGTLPQLAIGQRAVLEADHDEQLTGLSAPLANVLLKSHRVLLDRDTQQQLYRYTNGNPRLLHLFVALHQSGEPFAALLGELPRQPSIHFLLGRILQRLPETEISLLMELAVYQSPAPVDVWQRHPNTSRAMDTLYTRHLVQLDQQGGVTLLPAYRDVLLTTLPAEKVLQLHERAALTYQQRGRYTLAAHHFAHSAKPERAIWLWRDVQEQETNRGQAYAAFRVFQHLAGQPLTPPAREQVTYFCAALGRLLGETNGTVTDLRALLIKTPLLQVEAAELLGTIANDRGEFTRAEADFQRAIAIGEQLIGVRLAHAYKGLGWRYRSERLLQQAWHYGLLAQYEVANFQGELHYEQCHYGEAIAQFRTALSLAEQIGHADGRAKTCNNLGRIHTTIGEIESAQAYFAEAEQYYRQIGKAPAVDGMRINRAYLSNLAGDYDDALRTLEQFLAEKAQTQETLTPFVTALVYQNQAEALLGLGHLAEAKAAAQQAIDQEEITVLPDALRTHGEIMLQLGYPAEARMLICHALELIDQNEAPDLYLAGYAWRALAQVALAEQNTTLAQEHATNAVDCFRTINLPNEIERTHTLLGELLTGNMLGPYGHEDGRR